MQRHGSLSTRPREAHRRALWLAVVLALLVPATNVAMASAAVSCGAAFSSTLAGDDSAGSADSASRDKDTDRPDSGRVKLIQKARGVLPNAVMTTPAVVAAEVSPAPAGIVVHAAPFRSAAPVRGQPRRGPPVGHQSSASRPA